MKTLHRNHLLPVATDDKTEIDTTEINTVDQRPIPKRRQSKDKSQNQPDVQKDASDIEDSTIGLPLRNQEVASESESDEEAGLRVCHTDIYPWGTPMTQ